MKTNQASLAARLLAIVDFLPVFKSPGFEFGTWVQLKSDRECWSALYCIKRGSELIRSNGIRIRMLTAGIRVG